MTTVEREDELADAKRQGQAQYELIAGMVDRLKVAEEQAIDGPDETDAARSWIEQDALSVDVRSAWVAPGAFSETATKHGFPTLKPDEYRILLCTGGPAVQLIGELDEFCEPITCKMEVQDWFQPWTEFYPKGDDVDGTLLAYARVFYYGE